MEDSLQMYFSNLLGCKGRKPEIISDNARSRSSSSINFNNSDTSMDWFNDCCSVDTTCTVWSGSNGEVCFNRWETNESVNSAGKNQDIAIKPYARRRPLGEGSESGHFEDEATEADFMAIFMPTQKAMDEPCGKAVGPPRLPMRSPATPRVE